MDKKIFSMVKRLHYDFRFINIIDHDNVVKEASNLLKKSIFSNDFSFRYKIDKTITRKSNIYLRKINLIKKTTNSLLLNMKKYPLLKKLVLEYLNTINMIITEKYE